MKGRYTLTRHIRRIPSLELPPIYKIHDFYPRMVGALRMHFDILFLSVLRPHHDNAHNHTHIPFSSVSEAGARLIQALRIMELSFMLYNGLSIGLKRGVCSSILICTLTLTRVVAWLSASKPCPTPSSTQCCTR